MSFLDDLDETALVPAPAGQLASEKKQIDKIRQREDAIYEKGLDVVDGYESAAEIEGDEREPPKEWVEELGEKGAKKRLRVAKHALLSKKDAPIYLELTKATVTGIQKAREARGNTTINALNATFLLAAPPTAQGVMANLGASVAIAAPAPQKEYPVIDIEPEDEGEK